jgi:hypothetical protein
MITQEKIQNIAIIDYEPGVPITQIFFLEQDKKPVDGCMGG